MRFSMCAMLPYGPGGGGGGGGGGVGVCRGTYWWVRVLTSVAAFTPPSITRSQSCDYPAKIDLVHMRSSGSLHNVHALLTGHLDTLEANDSPALIWYDYLIVDFVSFSWWKV